MHSNSNWNNLLDRIDKCKIEARSSNVTVSQLPSALETPNMLVKIQISRHTHTRAHMHVHTHTHTHTKWSWNNYAKPKGMVKSLPWRRPVVYVG